MKLRNTIIVVAAVAMAAMIQTAQAAFTGTLAQLAAGGTLTIGDKTFSGFSYTPSGLTSFNPNNIIVTATESGGIDYLTWSGNISFVSGGVASADLVLNYIVAANAGKIDMIDQSYTGSGVNGTLAVDETVAKGAFGGTVVGYSHLQPGDLSDPPAEIVQGDNLIIDPSQSVLYVTKDIFLAVTSPFGGLSTLSEVSQSFHQEVPEPTTIIAGALLLLPFGASTLRILRKNRTA
jgi:hypothetical protein